MKRSLSMSVQVPVDLFVQSRRVLRNKGCRAPGSNHEKELHRRNGAEAEETLAEITEEVNRQQREYYRIFSKVLQELNRQDIYLYQDSRPEPFHEEFVHNFFNEEVFPFLSPVMIQAGDIRTFIRDRRLYLVIRMVKKSKRMAEPDYVPDYYYALMKIPYAKVPRFIELPTHEGKHYIMFSTILSGPICPVSSPVMWWRVVIASRFHGMPIFTWMTRKAGISWKTFVRK